MPKRKKEKPDDKDIEILTALYYLEGGTLYDLEKVVNLPRGTISNRLRWLESMGYLDEPIKKVYKGRFKKIYKPPDREKIIQAIMEEKAVKSDKELEIKLEGKVEEDVLTTLGYDLADFKEWSPDEIGMFDFTTMFVWEYLGLIKIKKGKSLKDYLFKLTERGIKKIIETYTTHAKTFLIDLRDFDEKAYKELLDSVIKEKEKVL